MTDQGPAPEALAAIQAWTRLENARAQFGRALERRYGVTGAQLGILRIVAEHDPGGITLARLRDRLVLHPATLGQLIDRLARRGLVALTPDPADRRSGRRALDKLRRLSHATAPRRPNAAAPITRPYRPTG